MRQNPHLLELSAWPWLERLSRAERREVTFASVPAAYWDRIAADGFDVVFLMGVWERSAIGRAIARTHAGLAAYDRVLPGWTDDDVPGSPYSIRAYTPDVRMGGWAGLEKARAELKRRNVSLLLDFVTNHTGFDHAWVVAHPERYVLGSNESRRAAPADFRTMDARTGPVHIACGRDPYFPPWTDVAQLNYFNPETRQAVRATLREIAAHCDGVRCDMAMLVLNDVFDRTWRHVLRERWPALPSEFWPDATADDPEFLYVAEVYWDLEARLLAEGFRFAYDKRLLDALRSTDRAARVRDALAASPPARLVRFLENHDEPRSAGTLSGYLPAALSLLLTLPGMRFVFDGQLEGRRTHPPVQLGRWPEEAPDAKVRGMYDRALRFAGSDVLHVGEWKILTASAAGDHSHEDVIAYRWRTSDALAVIVVNLGAGTAQAHVGVGDDLPAGTVLEFTDALNGQTYTRHRAALLNPGLYIRLAPGEAHLFDVRSAG